MGIDLGTSSTKIVLASETGEIVATASEAYPCDHPRAGWSEQDPHCWYDAAIAGSRAVLARAGIDGADVAALSFGGQMHGLVALDATGAVIRPAILWNDGRSTEECRYLNEVIGTPELSRRCSNIAFPGFTAPKLMWMKAHEPEAFDRIAMVLLPKDYLAYRLTGAFCTDVSDASGTLYFDVAHRTWSQPMLELLGITEDMLPRVYESWEPVGTLLPEVAREMGLEPNTVVCAGAGDNAAAAVGMGVVREGQCNLSLGTSGTVFLPTDELHTDEGNSLHAFADASGSYHLMGCILSAASANEWWIKRVLDSDFSAELDQIDLADLGTNNVYFLPYLMGERSPINDASARAAFLGMTADTARADMSLAVLEGVAFALKQSFDAALNMGVAVERLSVCGGGARSAVWKQILADVFEMPLVELGQEEGPGFGACILAMVWAGVYASVAEAVDAVVPKPVGLIEPQRDAAARYRQRYHLFCELYPSLKHVFHAMGEASR